MSMMTSCFLEFEDSKKKKKTTQKFKHLKNETLSYIKIENTLRIYVKDTLRSKLWQKIAL